jgi:hypothetical protein
MTAKQKNGSALVGYLLRHSFSPQKIPTQAAKMDVLKKTKNKKTKRRGQKQPPQAGLRDDEGISQLVAQHIASKEKIRPGLKEGQQREAQKGKKRERKKKKSKIAYAVKTSQVGLTVVVSIQKKKSKKRHSWMLLQKNWRVLGAPMLLPALNPDLAPNEVAYKIRFGSIAWSLGKVWTSIFLVVFFFGFVVFFCFCWLNEASSL